MCSIISTLDGSTCLMKWLSASASRGVCHLLATVHSCFESKRWILVHVAPWFSLPFLVRCRSARQFFQEKIRNICWFCSNQLQSYSNMLSYVYESSISHHCNSTLNKYFLIAEHDTLAHCSAPATASFHRVSRALVCFSFLSIFVLTLCHVFFFFFTHSVWAFECATLQCSWFSVMSHDIIFRNLFGVEEYKAERKGRRDISVKRSLLEEIIWRSLRHPVQMPH